MTTIAYRDGTIAYDSRFTSGDTIRDDAGDKLVIANGARFFFTGATADFDRFIGLYFGEPGNIENVECSAIVVEDGNLFLSAVNSETGLWKQPQRLDRYMAEGSGADHALTAMDMGATAKEAVKMAAKRDCKTGGRIRTYKL